jgi:hypothetical protein
LTERVLAQMHGDFDPEAFHALFVEPGDRAPLALYTAVAKRALVLGHVERVRAVLDDPRTSDALRIAAAIALPEGDAQAGSIVRASLESSDTWTRILALGRLELAPDESAVPAIAKLLADGATVSDLWEANRVSHWAARALLAAGRRDLLEGFIAEQRRALGQTKDGLARHFAVLFLARIGDEDAVAMLRELAEKDDPFGEYAAALGVWKDGER